MTAPAYLDRLQALCDAQGAGFHFEEGGCWGMALALHATLTADGHPAELVVFTPDVHAVVRVGPWMADYRGVQPWVPQPGQVEVHTPASLLQAAQARFGCTLDEVQADQALAQDLLTAAQELEADAQPAPMPRRSRRTP